MYTKIVDEYIQNNYTHEDIELHKYSITTDNRVAKIFRNGILIEELPLPTNPSLISAIISNVSDIDFHKSGYYMWRESTPRMIGLDTFYIRRSAKKGPDEGLFIQVWK